MSGLEDFTKSGSGAGKQFRPTATAETLHWRAALLAELRRFFEAHGYCEVETPILSRDVLVDAYVEPFTTRWMSDAIASTDLKKGAGGEMFLQTSPEFAMKRLLAAGMDAIYQVTRAFRNGESGRYHNPEFTMVEWYRVGDTHVEQMDFVESLVANLLERAPTLRPSPDETKRDAPAGSRITADLPFERVAYDAAFERYAGQMVLSRSVAELNEMAGRHGLVPPQSLKTGNRDDWLNWLLAELVEPHLGVERPAFLYDYPATQCALANVRDGDPPAAERFELYVRGIEVCNGYHELTDADELRRRIKRQATLRKQQGFRSLPEESRLLDAMDAGLPECAGVALGFDRLCMLAMKAGSLSEVLAFPFDNA